jgi:hypothetical protein
MALVKGAWGVKIHDFELKNTQYTLFSGLQQFGTLCRWNVRHQRGKL